MDIIQAARILRPGTAWNHIGGELKQAIDGTPRVTTPTAEEVQALMAADEYRALRANEYPPISDQLDAIWKGGNEFNEMKQRVDAVKAKYPKP
jgi:hypothetical protein